MRFRSVIVCKILALLSLCAGLGFIGLWIWCARHQDSPWAPSHPVRLGPGVSVVLDRENFWFTFEFAGGTDRQPMGAFACVCLSLLAAWLFFRTAVHEGRRWHQARSKGLCSHCGYDLRATPERCPERGMAVVTTGTSQ